MLNAAVNTPEARQFWSTPGCLPEEIGVIIDKGQFFCFEGKDLQLHLERGIYSMIVYSLVGFVADVDSGQHQKSHLVSLINGTYLTMNSRDISLIVFSGSFAARSYGQKSMVLVQRLFSSTCENRRSLEF